MNARVEQTGGIDGDWTEYTVTLADGHQVMVAASQLGTVVAFDGNARQRSEAEDAVRQARQRPA